MSATAETQVIMPQLGESIVEATLVAWHVAPGQAVKRGEPLADVETDKATNEVPAPRAGVIAALLITPGTTVPVGTPILRYAEATVAPAEAPRAVADAQPASAVADAGPARAVADAQPARADAQPASARADAGPARDPAVSAPPATAGRLPSTHLAPRAPGDARPASPAVRRLARVHGLELGGLRGTGRHGRVTREDVLAARSPTPASTAAPASAIAPASAPRAVYRAVAYAPQPGDRLVPFSRRRRYIAEHLRASLDTATHVAAVVEIDMGRVLRARQESRGRAEALGTKLSVTAYVVHALTRALGEHPELNASVVEDAHVLRRERNIGVAVDTAEGLVVPVIHRAEERSLAGLARAIDALAEAARTGALTANDLAGGSFTLSNPGRDGNLFGISIIRQPEVAILRMGEVQKRAVVRNLDGEDAIVIRPVMFAALSYDHRVIDGAKGNAFLHRVRALLEGEPPPLG